MSFNVLRHLPKSINKIHKPITMSHGKGTWVWGTDGKKYLDFTTGIGAMGTGHCHDHVVSAVQDQAAKYSHASQQIFGSHPAQIDLTKKMLSILPETISSIFYTNDGSGATDNAIKVARRFTGKTNIISVMGGFHGRTIGAMSLNSSGLGSKMCSQPLMPGVFTCYPVIDSLHTTLKLQSGPEETAAIFLEPIQGEFGVRELDNEFVREVRNVCNDYNIMMVADEIQCGSGRTGYWWASEGHRIVPDIINFGKAIGSGYPIAGNAARDDILDAGKNYLGGTYNGNAIASAAASATIDVIQNENLLDNVINMGDYLSQRITDTLMKQGMITDFRQYGLMIAVELNTKEIEPNALRDEATYNFVQNLRANNVLVLTAGNRGQFIRLLPPYNVSKEEIDYFIANFEKTYNSYTLSSN